MSIYLVINVSNEDRCLIDNTTTHTISTDKKHFSYFIMQETNGSTILDSTKLIEVSKELI